MSCLNIQGKTVKVTNLDKVFWPETGTTKGQLLEYYIKIAPRLLPCLWGRLVSVQRFPNGVGEKGFYQKNCPDNAPPWVNTFTVERQKGKKTNYVLVDSLATLVWLANLGAIEFHPWLSSIPTLDNPDYAVFDLDPMEKYGMDEVRQVALGIRDLLRKLNLVGCVKTSGSTGLQIFVPLVPIYSFQQVRDFVFACCAVIHNQFPAGPPWKEARKEKGKIYLDYMQNANRHSLGLQPSPRPSADMAPCAGKISMRRWCGGILCNPLNNQKPASWVESCLCSAWSRLCPLAGDAII